MLKDSIRRFSRVSDVFTMMRSCSDRDGDGWTVYVVDERDAVIESTLRTFDSESEAVERVLLKLRQIAEARRSLAAAAD